MIHLYAVSGPQTLDPFMYGPYVLNFLKLECHVKCQIITGAMLRSPIICKVQKHLHEYIRICFAVGQIELACAIYNSRGTYMYNHTYGVSVYLD